MKPFTLRPLALFLPFLMALSATAQPKLDTSFNAKGYKIVTGNKSIEFGGLKAVTAKDGSVFIAGYRTVDSLSVLKLLPGGAVDASFGAGGYSSTYIGGLQVSPWKLDIVLQRDKKIIVMAAGQRVTTPINNTETSIVLLRLNTNGSRDFSFNGTGLLIDRPNLAYQFTPLAIALDTADKADKIYVSSLAVETGNASCPLGYGQWCISKYSANGTRDLGFNNSGFIIESSSYIRNGLTKTPMAMVLALKVLAGGKLLAAGSYNAIDSAFFMFRMNANGSMDNTFGSAGRIYRPCTNFQTGAFMAMSANILSDESVVFSTHSDKYSSKYDSSILYAVKCNKDGSSATGFGTKGTLVTSYRTEGRHQLTIDSADRILLSWNQSSSGTQSMHFRCFTGNGAPDASFAAGGNYIIQPIIRDSALYAAVYDAVWATDNKSFYILQRRYDASSYAHIGVYKYKFGSKAALTATTVSVPEIIADVYPQPATDELNIRLSGIKQASVNLVNIQGQSVRRMDGLKDGVTLIDVSPLARGLYFLQVRDINGATQGRQVVVQ